MLPPAFARSQKCSCLSVVFFVCMGYTLHMKWNAFFQPSATATRGQKIAAIVSVAVFVLLLVFLTIFVGGPILKTLGEPASFREWVQERGAWGRVLFVGIMVLQVIIAFIPAEPLELAAGYAFGALWGSVLVWIGLVLGTTIVFLFVRKIGIKAVEVFFPREKIDSMKYLKNEKTLNAAAFLLFLIPGTPKDLITYLAGLTKIRLLPWVLLTSIARIPSILTSTISGNAFGLERYGLAIIVFAATALASGVGILLYRRAHQKHAQREAARLLAEQPLAEYGAETAAKAQTEDAKSSSAAPE